MDFYHLVGLNLQQLRRGVRVKGKSGSSHFLVCSPGVFVCDIGELLSTGVLAVKAQHCHLCTSNFYLPALLSFPSLVLPTLFFLPHLPSASSRNT